MNNLIAYSLKKGVSISAQEWQEWNKEINNSLKSDLAADKAANLSPKDIVLKRIKALEAYSDELISAQKHIIKTKQGALIETDLDEVHKLNEKVFKVLKNEYLTLINEESSSGNWKAINKNADSFLKRVSAAGFSANSFNVDDIRLLKIESDYRISGNTPKFREGIKKALDQIKKSGASIKRQTAFANAYMRYAISTGSATEIYRAFWGISPELRGGLDGSIGDILFPSGIEARERVYPCNFYTYHYTLMADDFFQTINDFFSFRDDSLTPTLPDAIYNANPSNSLRIFRDIFKYWNDGINSLHQKKYSGALSSFEKSQLNIITILKRTIVSEPRYSLQPTIEEIDLQINEILNTKKEFRFGSGERLFDYLKHVRADTIGPRLFLAEDERRNLGQLQKLYEFDWKETLEGNSPLLGSLENASIYRGSISSAWLLFQYLEKSSISIDKRDASSDERTQINFRWRNLDFPLINLLTVFIPFAKIEACRFSKQFERALEVVDTIIKRDVDYGLLNPFIELPFLQILKAQILLEQGNKLYKSGQTSSVSGAKATYQRAIDCFGDLGDYNRRVGEAAVGFSTSINSFREDYSFSVIYGREMSRPGRGPALPPASAQIKLSFQAAGNSVYLENVTGRDERRLASVPRRDYPTGRLLRIGTSVDTPLLESNPLIYSIVFEATARIRAIDAGFNYLGYREDYVPPWRFSFLLDRARYYADQAKNLQRDYLNFLSNAEREEFQEMSVGQSVSMERMNIAVEAARVDQSQAEMQVAIESNELAQLQLQNSQARLDNYSSYNDSADVLDAIAVGALAVVAIPALIGAIVAVAVGAGAGAVVAGATGAAGPIGGITQLFKEGEQRDMEIKNLELNVREAEQSVRVASAQLNVSQASLEVSNLQAQATLMRYEFALDNYEYLRNRLTSAELWFRLAHNIREIAQSYLQRAIEMSFLAEQAYEFMIDKRINTIRFDYDDSELGDMLGADFLKADLDYLENHLITTQRDKQQQIKCVISLARDFPEALNELRENESVIFPIVLRYLEQRFPGIYGLKVAGIDVQFIALTDPTRFTIELTHLGSGSIRTKYYPTTPDGSRGIGDDRIYNTVNEYDDVANSDWLSDPDVPNALDQFTVSSLLSPVETHVFTGLTANEEGAFFLSFSAQQKSPFEDFTPVAGWRIDMSMTENKVIPGSLADVLLTFYLTGYYDSDLKQLVENRIRIDENRIVNQVYSARAQFSESFFNFQETGRISWRITPQMLSFNSRIGNLREIGIYLQPKVSDITFNRFRSATITKLTVNAAGNGFQNILSPAKICITRGVAINEIVYLLRKEAAIDNLTVFVEGDELNPFINQAFALEDPHPTGNYTFRRSGRFIIVTRVVQTNQLYEYKSEVFISTSANPLILPVSVYPTYSLNGGNIGINIDEVDNTGNEIPSMAFNCIGQLIDESGKVQGEIRHRNTDGNPSAIVPSAALVADKTYYLILTASKPWRINVSSFQRMRLNDGNAFDGDINKLTTNNSLRDAARNQLTRELFGNLAPTRIYSPCDKWEFTIPVDENPFIQTYDVYGNLRTNMDFLEDVILFLEFDSTRMIAE